MKNILFAVIKFFAGRLFPLMVLAVLGAESAARAGLTLTLDVYVQSQGRQYVFYTPLSTNSLLPAAPLGSYFISSPQWPTNGSTRGFQLTTNGLSDIYSADSEYGYGDLGSALRQITNGTWRILFTNTTTTNLYTFTVSASSVPTNLLPATIVTFPPDGSVILPNQTNFVWQGPTNWAVNGYLQTYNNNGYYQSASLPAAQMNWNVDSSLPAETNYTFNLHYVTNYAAPLFVASTPLSTNTLQPVSGWASSNIFETGSSSSFTVVPAYGPPYQGHTCFAHYTFEDNNLFVHDFSGNNNNMSYAWFTVPPTIVTNDAVAGMYAGGWGGSGWFTPPDNLRSLFAGSFSVSLWLQTTNVHGNNSDDEYAAAGIVSDLGSDYNESAMPMGQTGSKLTFYTGGSSQNLLHSHADINTGQYVHLVTTRDQQTGEKRIYVNGVLDASVHAVTDLLTSYTNGDLTIGYNNGNVFTGVMDEIEFYSGVLSSSDVAFLHSHPGTNVADTLEVAVPVARIDFEQTNNPSADSSGHNNNLNCTSGTGGTNLDIYSTNAAVGTYARQFFGDTSYCFAPGGTTFLNLSNALTGSFSVAAWVNTTNSAGSDYNNAYFGSPILFLYNSDTNSTIPLTITGSKAAFTIYDQNGNAVTLHSTTTVNDGVYHLLAVTRDQPSGLMCLYVDGNRRPTNTSTTQPLQIPWIHLAGGYFVSYQGLLDDVRIYSGAMTAGQVAQLYGNSPFTFGGALNAPQLPWATSGDTPWFVENTNTYDGVAAQSGIVTNYQMSVLSTTVNGPGTLTFYWSSLASGDFDYEFDIDGYYGDDISGDTAWYQEVDWRTGLPYVIPSGPHVLTWTAYASDDNDPTEAGFLDQVSYVPSNQFTLTSPQVTGTNFQFAFQSQANFNYAIQYTTNLVSGAWQTWSNFTGDGTLKTYPVPFSIFAPAKQGFIRVATQ